MTRDDVREALDAILWGLVLAAFFAVCWSSLFFK